ncbi:DUF3280 domain-containing protein [Labrenzia aggregata]|uniref:DUF3280 domain-containing protein n=2 Tax=Roseibium aggregatum TaxID=187304 RepID=A0A939EI14_9HYPH|nr:DUF3280 domain-containing protein [Roseibium aggregatum]
MLRVLTTIIAVFWSAIAYGTPYPVLEKNSELAVLGFSFVDMSTEGAYNGARDDQTARVQLLNTALRDRLSQEGFTVLSNEPIAEALDAIKNPARCNNCELKLARELGARYVVVGEIRKISNLILSISLVMREAETGVMVRALAVDIRSNTDKSWLRGLNYILKNHFFKQ